MLEAWTVPEVCMNPQMACTAGCFCGVLAPCPGESSMAAVSRGVTNQQIALDCLSTRPVPSASQDVRAGFLFGGLW
jgi:hypothetical protein